MNNKKGFVFVETIVVLCVLSILLVAIYISFSAIINNQKKRAMFDQTTYLYFTRSVRNLIENELGNQTLNNVDDYIVINSCTSDLIQKKEICNELWNKLNVDKIFITKNDVKDLYEEALNANQTEQIYTDLGGNIIDYLKTLEPIIDKSGNELTDLRIIVGYKIVSNKYCKTVDNCIEEHDYYYASLRYRGGSNE